jgi:hypothetical protein
MTSPLIVPHVPAAVTARPDLRIPARPPLFNRAWLLLVRAGSGVYVVSAGAVVADLIGAFA